MSTTTAPAKLPETLERGEDCFGEQIGSTPDVGAPAVTDSRERGVTLRVVIFSLLLALLFGYVIPVIDYLYTNTFLGAAHLPAGAVAVLLILLLGLNPLLRLFSGKLAFSRNEILTIYITCLFSTLVPGRGGENYWIPNVIASFYYATQENNWLEFLQPYLKPWFTPALSGGGAYQPDVIAPWYAGMGEEAVIPWGAWLVPLVAWLAIVTALYTMMACLAVMLRAQWAEREALAFPLLRLPLEMTEDADESALGKRSLGRFFHNPLMWVGFSISVFIQLLNGLNLYFPDVPAIPLAIDTRVLFTESPWNQVGTIVMRVWPAVVGISFLLTSEVSFSLWFFYLFHKAQLIIAYYLGFAPASLPDPVWTRGFSKSFIAFQQVGAIFAYSALVLWVGREHLKHIVRRAFGRERSTPAEHREALSYPVAFWGFVVSSLFVLAWTAAAGVRLDIALAMWVTYFVVAIALTRLVVEAGLLMVHTGWSPLGPLSSLTGSWIPASSAVPAAFIGGALMSEMRGFLLPSFVQSFKLAHDRKIAAKPLLALIACVLLLATLTSWITIVQMGYNHGGLQLQEWWARGNGALGPGRNAKEMIANDVGVDILNWFWMGFGAVVTTLLTIARARLSWFPLHPIGYVIFTPFAITTLWFSIFLGWGCKTLLTRFGGTDAYRKTIPAFLGLALGDVAMMIFWVAIDAWQGRMGHYLMPN